MNLDKINDLSTGKRIAVIIAFNVVMLVTFNLFVLANIKEITSVFVNEVTFITGMSVAFTMTGIFFEVIFFLISFIVINISLITKHFKGALITFVIVILVTIVSAITVQNEFDQLVEDTDNWVEQINELSSGISSER